MAQTLTPDDLARALRGRPGWQVDGGRLIRTVTAPSFRAGVDLVVAVALEAERMDHHPDIDIRWREVTFALMTHSAGGLTGLDLELAAHIDRAVQNIGTGTG